MATLVKARPRGNPSKAGKKGGKIGGKVTSKKLGAIGREARATKGGQAVIQKYGKDYFSALGKHAMKKRWSK